MNRHLPVIGLVLAFAGCQVASPPEPALAWVRDSAEPRPQPDVAPGPPPGGHDYDLCKLPLTIENARRVVLEATVWAPDGFGLARWPHPPRASLQLLLRQPQSGELLEELYRGAATPGRLLVLCALHLGRDARFQRLAAPLVGSAEKVDTFVGCSGISRTAGEILTAISTTDTCQDTRR